jgi:rRNA maturation endonuclease Nob1
LDTNANKKVETHEEFHKDQIVERTDKDYVLEDKDLNKTTQPSLVSNVVDAAKSAGLRVKEAAAGAMERVKEALSSDEDIDRTAEAGKRQN